MLRISHVIHVELLYFVLAVWMGEEKYLNNFNFYYGWTEYQVKKNYKRKNQ